MYFKQNVKNLKLKKGFDWMKFLFERNCSCLTQNNKLKVTEKLFEWKITRDEKF